jgi:hypothetical protein
LYYTASGIITPVGGRPLHRLREDHQREMNIKKIVLNMFRVVFHPSSGAHTTVSTVYGINETVTATCRERGWT